tara:strand:- start:176 stop:430 length:255 start_codon:yes stop_codon:yes gene_type:complete
MAITKENIIEKIDIVGEFKHINIATDLVIKEDGTEISRSRKRKVLAADMNISAEDNQVQSIANIVWTQAVKDAWAARLAKDKEG